MRRILPSATICALVLALAGCGQANDAVQSTAQPVVAPAAAATVARRAGMTDTDRAFIAAATGDNAFLDALGHMALEKSSTDEMHALAQRMVEDHARMGGELASFTEILGTDQASPSMPADQALQLRNHLAPLQGDAFRNAFIDVAIREHHLVVALFAGEAKNGHDKALRSFARKELPALREHLAMAQAMLTAGGPAPQG